MSSKDQSENPSRGTVRLTGHIDVPEERSEAVQAALPVHIALTRAEEGCLSFEVVPCPQVPHRFLVSELFVDQSAFDAHQKRTKDSSWAEVTEGIPREYSITVQD